MSTKLQTSEEKDFRMVDNFNLPDVGEGLTEAEIVSWRVAVGDTVAVNDIVVEIETAKSLVELPIPYAGHVEELVASEGETIEVGSPLIRISRDGPGAGSGDADADADTPDNGADAAEAPAVAEEEPKTSSGGESDALVGSGPKADAPRRRPRTRHTQPDLVDVSDLGLSEETDSAPRDAGQDVSELVARTSPPVRALAKRLGVAVRDLVGSGGGGKITRDDVERRARQKKGQDTEAASTSPAEPSSNGLLLRDGPREEEVQVRGVRKATAANVTESASTVPHVTVFKEIDVTRTMELRAALKQDPSYEGLGVSPLFFAAKAIIWAARRNPQVNASWHETHYVVKNYVNLGIAAATPRGLMVPVIHDVQSYSSRGLAAAITGMIAEAREGRLTPADMQGGTVSITNIGPLGLDGGTPILPPGQAAIVALGAVRRKPWVVDEQIVPRDVMTIGGSFDHRLIDGEHAGRFISDVGAVLEQPGLLLD